MKKLMTAMATAATALFAIGAANGDDAPLNATSFEQLTPNTQLNTLADDTGDTEGDVKYWFMAATDADNGTLVTNDVAGASVSRPDYFAQASNTNSLALDTSSPLFRHMGTSDGTLPANGVAIDAGIYLDTLVKFTAADDVFGEDALAAGDKIAISYVEQSDEVQDPITNFVIRAGYIESSGRISAKNYEAKLVLPNDAKFDKDVWHRLTVRTVPNIDAAENGNVGFVVYVDETALVYADDDETIGDEEVELVGVAATVPNSVFPSAVASAASGGSTITSASFSGTGAIDDVVFTKKMPSFIASSSKIPVTFTIPSGVTSVDVTVGDAQPVSVTAANPTVELEAGTTEFTLAVNIEQGSGYTFSGITGATMDEYNVVTVSGASMAITINVTRNNFIYIDADDAQQSAVTLTDALVGVKAGGMIKLAYDYNVGANETVSDSTPVYVISKDIVLDLNGKTLDGGSSDVRLLFSTDQNCVLTVIDSVEGDTGKIVYGGTYGTFGGQGDIYIGSTELTDYGVVVDGSLCGVEFGYVSEVVRGKFLASGNTTSDKFVYLVEEDDLLNMKSTAERVGDYWVVTYDGEQPPAPAVVNFSVEAAKEHSSVVIKTNDVVVAYADLPATLTEGQTYEVTYTADEGYHLVTGQVNQTSIVVSGTVAKADIAITAPTVEQDLIGTYTVNVTPNANATYAAAYKVGGETITPENDVLTVTVGQTIVITATPAEDYEYAEAPTGWTAGQDGEITIEVSEAGTVAIPAPTAKQQGEYPSYIDTTDADAKAKYDAWKDTYGADTASAYEDAFLLNCAPANVNTEKAAFKFTKIAFEGGVWVTETTTKNTAGDDYNGEVVVTRYSDVGCTEKSETGSFFKAELK